MTGQEIFEDAMRKLGKVKPNGTIDTVSNPNAQGQALGYVNAIHKEICDKEKIDHTDIALDDDLYVSENSLNTASWGVAYLISIDDGGEPMKMQNALKNYNDGLSKIDSGEKPIEDVYGFNRW